MNKESQGLDELRTNEIYRKLFHDLFAIQETSECGKMNAEMQTEIRRGIGEVI